MGGDGLDSGVGGAPVRKRRPAAGEKLQGKMQASGRSSTGLEPGRRQDLPVPGACARVDFREFEVTEGFFGKKCSSSNLNSPATLISGRTE